MLSWWFALMSFGGLVAGALAERRSFDIDVLLHALLACAVAIGVVLLILRLASARRLREIMSHRKLIVACAVSIAAFVVGSWLGMHLAALR